jgi:HTH-type transcriptional regulator/antitoxin HigA
MELPSTRAATTRTRFSVDNWFILTNILDRSSKCKKKNSFSLKKLKISLHASEIKVKFNENENYWRFVSMKMPGEEIRKCLRDRGWTQADLARVIGRPLQTVNAIIVGRKTITPETAISLGAAFGTGPEKWMNLESAYRLSLAKSNTDCVEKRAKLYKRAPIKDMERRGWIAPATSVEEQEHLLCQFFEIKSLDKETHISVATRKSAGSNLLNPSQKAWCFRARHLARILQVVPLKKKALKSTADKLRELAAYPEQSRHVSRTLAECGIRFLVIEPLPGTRIDGATIWLDECRPVIALSLRYDRVDAFWFTLLHEFYHVVHEHASVDDDLYGDGQIPSIAKEGAERLADTEASAQLIPTEKLESFIMRVSPLYSKPRINQFAHTINIHPGIVVGQLQHRGEIGYSANREMLVKVRDIVISEAVTDGWGRRVHIDTNRRIPNANKTKETED